MEKYDNITADTTIEELLEFPECDFEGALEKLLFFLKLRLLNLTKLVNKLPKYTPPPYAADDFDVKYFDIDGCKVGFKLSIGHISPSVSIYINREEIAYIGHPDIFYPIPKEHQTKEFKIVLVKTMKKFIKELDDYKTKLEKTDEKKKNARHKKINETIERLNQIL